MASSQCEMAKDSLKKILKIVCVYYLIFFIGTFLTIKVSILLENNETNEIKQEFMQYNTTNDSNLYFYYYRTINYENTETRLYKLFNDKTVKQGCFIDDKEIYFVATSKAKEYWSVFIYDYNVESKNNRIIFEQDGYYSSPEIYINQYNGFVYITYEETNKINYIDSYDIINNEFKNKISSDKELSDYFYNEECVYDIALKNTKYFEITNKIDNTNKIVDGTYLKDTIYYESLKKFDFRPYKSYYSNNHLFLLYVSDGINLKRYGTLFEYNYEQNSMELKMIIYDIEDDGLNYVIYDD